MDQQNLRSELASQHTLEHQPQEDLLDRLGPLVLLAQQVLEDLERLEAPEFQAPLVVLVVPVDPRWTHRRGSLPTAARGSCWYFRGCQTLLLLVNPPRRCKRYLHFAQLHLANSWRVE